MKRKNQKRDNSQLECIIKRLGLSVSDIMTNRTKEAYLSIPGLPRTKQFYDFYKQKLDDLMRLKQEREGFAKQNPLERYDGSLMTKTYGEIVAEWDKQISEMEKDILRLNNGSSDEENQKEI